MKNINWKQVGVAVASVLAALSALPYSLGDIATVIPPAWKPKLFVVSAAAAIALRLWNAATIPPPK